LILLYFSLSSTFIGMKIDKIPVRVLERERKFPFPNSNVQNIPNHPVNIGKRDKE